MSGLLCASLLSIALVRRSCPGDPPAQAGKAAWPGVFLCCALMYPAARQLEWEGRIAEWAPQELQPWAVVRAGRELRSWSWGRQGHLSQDTQLLAFAVASRNKGLGPLWLS